MNRSILQIRKFLLSKSSRFYSKKNIDPIENEPIKFSSSPAAKRNVIKPIVNRLNTDMPWYQPHCVSLSVTVFMIYFCLLREESDLDQTFETSLYERIGGLEKTQLLQAYKYNKEQGKDVAEIEQRLKLLEAEEAKA